MRKVSAWSDQEIFSCDCSDPGHTLRVTASYWGEDDQFATIEVSNDYHPEGFRRRVATAWKTLRGKPIYISEVCLNKFTHAGLVEALTDEKLVRCLK